MGKIVTPSTTTMTSLSQYLHKHIVDRRVDPRMCQTSQTHRTIGDTSSIPSGCKCKKRYALFGDPDYRVYINEVESDTFLERDRMYRKLGNSLVEVYPRYLGVSRDQECTTDNPYLDGLLTEVPV